MFVPQKYRSMTSQALEDYIECDVFDPFCWDVFLMIDYNNHHKDDNYDNGLSFIDRINKTLGWFYKWDINKLKNSINNEKSYITVIASMLDHAACCMYGLHYVEKRIL